ncbi:hypothetical protein [Minwuia thermotolerans]|nr:hypothetical protein [Minwuia thermotolerans]
MTHDARIAPARRSPRYALSPDHLSHLGRAEYLLGELLERADVIETPAGPVLAFAPGRGLLAALADWGADLADDEPDGGDEPDDDREDDDPAEAEPDDEAAWSPLLLRGGQG